MSKITLFLIPFILCNCYSGPARLFDKLSFEDNQKNVTVYNYGGTVYVNINNPDGYDEYREYLKPRTVFIERDTVDTEKIKNDANFKYEYNRQTAKDIAQFSLSINSGNTQVPVSKKENTITPKPIVSTQKPILLGMSSAKRINR